MSLLPFSGSIEELERKVGSAVNCMSDRLDFYSATNGLKSGVTRSLSALKDVTDGRLVRSANVVCSSNEVSLRRPWKKGALLLESQATHVHARSVDQKSC